MEPTAQPDVPRERRHRQALQGEAATALMDQTLSAERRQLMLSAKIDGSDSAAPDARANRSLNSPCSTPPHRPPRRSRRGSPRTSGTRGSRSR